MRKLVFVVCLALLILSFCAPLCRAQFTAPTPEELKMTADPKAPGAAAVYLYREETTDDRLHYRSIYERIKVLTEKGKELATVRIPYDRTEEKVSNIQGRTIHPDGSVTPLAVKPADLLDVKTKGFQQNSMVFTLPAVEVGSILEYRVTVFYPDEWVSAPRWDIQQRYFVHRAHYFFKEATENGIIMDARGNEMGHLMFSQHLGVKAPIAKDRVKDGWVLDLNDVPALLDEDWAPPLNTLTWRVDFFYTRNVSGPEFWKDEGKNWAHVVSGFFDLNVEMRQIAASLVAPGDTETQKAEKIYTAVAKLENTSFTREKSEAERKREKLKQVRRAEDVWAQKAGTRDELALLYVALARAAKLKAWPMLVVNRDRAIFDPDLLSMRQLDDYVAIVSADGKELALDPGEKMCPFGQLHWKHAMASGLRLNDQGPAFATTPAIAYKNSSLQRVATLNLGLDGAVTGTVRLTMAGPEALRWRQTAIENDQEEIKKQFVEWIRASLPDGVEAEFSSFFALDDPSKNLMASLKVSGSLASTTGKRTILPGVFFQSRARHPFTVGAVRKIGVDMHYPELEIDDVTYFLPAGLSPESLPQAVSEQWPGFAMLKIEPVVDGSTIEIKRFLVHNFTVLDPANYGPLHDFYQKVAAADQQPLVLVKTPATQGGAQ